MTGRNRVDPRELERGGAAAGAGSSHAGSHGQVPDAAPLRPVLLALTLLVSAGLLGELALLEHTESVWQWLPFVGLGAALVGGALVAARPARWSLLLFRAAMLLVLALGLLGLYLHYVGNVEFERELEPAARGWYLVWGALRGATPSLAPGAMLHAALLGLLFTWRHPCLDAAHRRAPARPSTNEGSIS
ncbi:MAG TPA: hypothetical protein VMK65_06705 [Longimicrobiales bacterium]|nr:hypothetical protein [Longimicrobiales bacterium]